MLELIYAAAIRSLSWSDTEIMECDLVRLNFAIDAKQKAEEVQWLERYKIAGWKVEQPLPEPGTNEEFNEQLRSSLALFRKPKKKD